MQQIQSNRQLNVAQIDQFNFVINLRWFIFIIKESSQLIWGKGNIGKNSFVEQCEQKFIVKNQIDIDIVVFIIVKQKIKYQIIGSHKTALRKWKILRNAVDNNDHQLVNKENCIINNKVSAVQQMSSPYSMRVRTSTSVINPDRQFIKKLECSPRTSYKRQSEYETNISQKMIGVQNNQYMTPKAIKNRVHHDKRIQSYSEISNIQLHSNSINEQSIVQEKYKRCNDDVQNNENNIQLQMSDKNIIVVKVEMEKCLQGIEKKKNFEDELIQNKKSYRKNNNLYYFGVPYRKCHSAMQQKVVSIINKIKSGKDCHKQIQTLMDRTKKVPLKQLHNKYFVSGIQLLCNIVIQKQYKDMFSAQLIGSINDGLDDLRSRVLNQMDNTKGFQVEEVQDEEVVYQKLELVRRAYRVLRKKLRSLQREQVQNKAIKAADWFIENRINDLYKFNRELREIYC